MSDKSSASNRRAFLRGQAAGRTWTSWIDDRLAPPEPPAADDTRHLGAPASDSLLVSVGRRAMACEFAVFFNAGQYRGDTVSAMTALDIIAALEEQLSVYRPTSEVSRLNLNAAAQAVQVEPGLCSLLERCHELFDLTGGAFDITAGPLIRAWGFDRRQGHVPTDDALAAARRRVGSQHLSINGRERTVRLAANAEINLGAIGKGYALDLAAAGLEAAGISDFLWHGGQSSVLARGQRLDGGHPGWPVGIGDPSRPGRRLAELDLCDQALGTSGAGTQFFESNGRRYGHLLDPRTGWPAEGALSATVVTRSAADADALATAAYIMGPDEGAASLAKITDTWGLWVLPSPHGAPLVEVVLSRPPDEHLRWCSDVRWRVAGSGG